MKKIALFACTMLLCAGIAMAQEPVKKPAKGSTTTTTATVKSDKGEAQVAHKGCGNCPNHKQCAKGAEAQDAAKTESKSCCQKDAQKPCNKEAAKTAQKGAENKPAKK